MALVEPDSFTLKETPDGRYQLLLKKHSWSTVWLPYEILFNDKESARKTVGSLFILEDETGDAKKDKVVVKLRANN